MCTKLDNYNTCIILILITIRSEAYGLSEVCEKSVKCVSKCCPEGHYVNALDDDNAVCTKNGDSIPGDNFADVPIYKENGESSGKHLSDVFVLVKGELFQQQVALDEAEVQPYLLENGTLALHFPPFSKEMIDNNNFCVERTLDTLKPVFRLRPIEEEETRDIFKMKLNIAGFMISSVFLALVLAVYTLFGSLRTHVGKIFMSLAASLLGLFVLYSSLYFKMDSAGQMTKDTCLTLHFFIYFFYVASFFWMNVYSYDIWKQFRKYEIKSDKDKKQQQTRKLLCYSAYAWGVPLVMAILLLLLELDVLVEDSPNLTLPHIIYNRCRLIGKERLYYMYIPMLILICINGVFFSTTAYRIWQIMRVSTNAGLNSTPNSTKERVLIFTKLSVVVGIMWVMEAVSWLAPSWPIWYVTDTYNTLIGLPIFIITVCNKNVYKLLKKRFGSKLFFWNRSKTNAEVQGQSTALTSESSNALPLTSVDR